MSNGDVHHPWILSVSSSAGSDLCVQGPFFFALSPSCQRRVQGKDRGVNPGNAEEIRGSILIYPRLLALIPSSHVTDILQSRRDNIVFIVLISQVLVCRHPQDDQSRQYRELGDVSGLGADG